MRISKIPEQVKHAPVGTKEDPVLRMMGVGRAIWEAEPADRFVERLRAGDEAGPPAPGLRGRPENPAATVWSRIQKHQAQPFHTARGLPFTFHVEGNGIWFFRDKKRVNRKLSRTQVEVAISRCPLRSTTEIKDLTDYPYLFAILTDPRIRGQAW